MQQYIGFTMQTIGEIFIAFTVLKVHQRVLKEHRIDNSVLKIIKLEQLIGIFGIIFIVLGYVVTITAE
ncbi:MAG: hypothetical protein P1P90_02980 [Patescibacteria group bacterium]|nr:hypothetical protein [Patescibacteria group bacterium]